MNEQQRYLSYLLRLWQTSDGEAHVWRASLQTPGTGERRGFANVQDLLDFLLAQTQDEQSRTISHQDKTDEGESR